MVFAAKRVTIEQPHATFLARADQKLAVAKSPVRRIELRVTGAEVDGAVRRNRRATSAPEPSPRGNEGARTARRQIVGIKGVGQTAAALGRRGIDDAVLQVQSVRFAATGNELFWRRRIFAVGKIEL